MKPKDYMSLQYKNKSFGVDIIIVRYNVKALSTHCIISVDAILSMSWVKALQSISVGLLLSGRTLIGLNNPNGILASSSPSKIFHSALNTCRHIIRKL